MVDAAHQKEGLAKETIGTLKTEIKNLSRLIEQGAGLSLGQEIAVKELSYVVKELCKERDAQVKCIRFIYSFIGSGQRRETRRCIA